MPQEIFLKRALVPTQHQSDLSFADFLNGVSATPPTADTALNVVDNAVPATQPTPPTTVAALL